MTLTAYGIREWLGAAIIAGLLSLLWLRLMVLGHSLTGGSLLVLTWLLWLVIAAFFRVPARTIPADSSLLLSPADGVVRDITLLSDHDIEPFAGQELIRIGIFLSVLDVHVNRAPCQMRVSHRHYKPGAFHDARNARCIRENEALTLAGEGDAGGLRFPVAIRQISGAIARRIVCRAQPGDRLEPGRIYGMIKFGSRTELYFPADSRIRVKVKPGDRVKSGTSILAQVIRESTP
jgi:phosphatidylserine decarboxylase